MNEKYEIFRVTKDGTTVIVHALNPGETFERFGGSRHGLTVRKTASLVVSTKTPWDYKDVEYDLRDQDTWNWLIRLINHGGV